MRRDARERRAALLVAAEACFRERGFLVPLDDIARRAGVSRGTLYRNFADRMALVLALFDDELTHLGDSLADVSDTGQALREFVLGGARMAALYNRLAADMPADHGSHAGLLGLHARAIKLLEPIVRAAKAQGRLRRDVTPADILLLGRMVGGVLSPWYGAEQARANTEAAFRLISAGVLLEEEPGRRERHRERLPDSSTMPL